MVNLQNERLSYCGEFAGLDDSAVIESRKKHGSNELSSYSGKSIIRRILENLNDPIIRILLIALVANIIFTIKSINWAENGGIILAVIISTVVSTLSERGSEKAFEKLREEASGKEAVVIRNGMERIVNINDIVVGDLVVLSGGDIIPCDGTIISGNMFVDQSALNGESEEIQKRPEKCDGDNSFQGDSDLKSRSCLFRGSVGVSGQGIMRAWRVGGDTLYGKIAGELKSGKRSSPMRHRLEKLSVTLSRIGYIAAALVAFAYLINVIVIDSAYDTGIILSRLSDIKFVASSLIKAFTIAITVIVVAVPEGLPMMITVVLSSNMKRMLRDNVLVRQGTGIETAGSMNILFTDKTGTITSGALRVKSLISGEAVEYKSISALEKAGGGGLCKLVLASCICNSDAKVISGKPSGGNLTERALLEFVSHRVCDAQVIERLSFDSDIKYSSVSLPGITLYKGAPEKILPLCDTFYADDGSARKFSSMAAIKRKINEISSHSGRVIVMSAKVGGELAPLPDKMTFICAVNIKDPIRRDAKKAIDDLRSAGIKTVMITGDSKATARAVAEECRLAGSFDENSVIDSQALAKLSDRELASLLPHICVVARALPSDKSRLVRVAQDMGMVVGMTGDGINDAPALRLADVGFAMGSGRDIAKQASDIVILDDRLTSIKMAVLYGRTVFKSIRKFIMFQLTMNLCAVGVSFFGQLMGIDAPVTVVQMLWVNIIMDTLGGLAFSGEPPLDKYMKEKPKKRDEPIISRELLFRVLSTGAWVIAICTAFLSSEAQRRYYGFYEKSSYFLTAFFALFIFSGIAVSFISRSDGFFLSSNLTRNKPFMLIMSAVSIIQLSIIYFGGSVFRCVGLSLPELMRVLIVSVIIIPADYIRKIFKRLIKKRKSS